MIHKESNRQFQERVDDLYWIAVATPRGPIGTQWPLAHSRFVEAYIAFFRIPYNNKINWDIMRDKYSGFYQLYTQVQITAKVNNSRNSQKLNQSS